MDPVDPDSDPNPEHCLCLCYVYYLCRELGSRVMIVQGHLSGEVGELMDKDKGRCRATIRLLHSGQLLHKSYEDICDFVGSSQDDLD